MQQAVGDRPTSMPVSRTSTPFDVHPGSHTKNNVKLQQSDLCSISSHYYVTCRTETLFVLTITKHSHSNYSYGPTRPYFVVDAIPASFAI